MTALPTNDLKSAALEAAKQGLNDALAKLPANLQATLAPYVPVVIAGGFEVAQEWTAFVKAGNIRQAYTLYLSGPGVDTSAELDKEDAAWAADDKANALKVQTQKDFALGVVKGLLPLVLGFLGL